MAATIKFYNTKVAPADDLGLDLGDSTHRYSSAYILYIVPDTTTGLKIGTATSQKVGFFNATPIIQPISTTDLRTLLINLGLLASGGASPLDLNGGTFTTSGTANIGTLTLTSATNFVFNNDELLSYNDEVVFT